MYSNGGLKTAGGSDDSTTLATPLVNFSFEKALQALGSDSAAAAASGGFSGNAIAADGVLKTSSSSGLEDVADEVLKMQRKQRKEKEKVMKAEEDKKARRMTKEAAADRERKEQEAEEAKMNSPLPLQKVGGNKESQAQTSSQTLPQAMQATSSGLTQPSQLSSTSISSGASGPCCGCCCRCCPDALNSPQHAVCARAHTTIAARITAS